MIFSQDDIGMTRQLFHMQAVSNTMPMQKPAHQQFGARVLASDVTHHDVTLLWCENISHKNLGSSSMNCWSAATQGNASISSGFNHRNATCSRISNVLVFALQRWMESVTLKSE